MEVRSRLFGLLWGRAWFSFSCQMWEFTLKHLETIGVLLFTAEPPKYWQAFQRLQAGMKKGFIREQRALEYSHISAPQAHDMGQPPTVRPWFSCLWNGDDCSCPLFSLHGATLGMEWGSFSTLIQSYFEQNVANHGGDGGGEEQGCLWDGPDWTGSL